jgi:hypothetical protein
MTSPVPNEVTLHADQEHAGLRAVVLLTVIVAFFLGFFILNPILRGGDGLLAAYALPISCVAALATALVIAGIAEYFMKRYWPSGRRLVIDDDGLEAWLPDGQKATLAWSGRVWALAWTFSLAGYPRGGRERRLTKNHHCFACQLQQDDVRLVVFSYFKGKEAESFLEGHDFRRLEPAEYYERGIMRRLRGATDRPKLPTSLLTGKDGPYWLGEQRRWANGLELSSKDFETFWAMVGDRIEA